jgi:hypothetical protein
MNNSNPQFPPLMNDGRMFTDYVPTEFSDVKLSEQMGFKNVYQQREYYFDNATQLMEKEELDAETNANWQNTNVVVVDPNGNDAYWFTKKKQLVLLDE